MFTDIAGYTAMMGKDEEKAIAWLRKNREIQKPLIEEPVEILPCDLAV